MNIFTYLDVQYEDFIKFVPRTDYDTYVYYKPAQRDSDIVPTTDYTFGAKQCEREQFDRIVQTPTHVINIFSCAELLKLHWFLKVMCDAKVKKAFEAGEVVNVNGIVVDKAYKIPLVFESFTPTMPWVAHLKKSYSLTKDEDYQQNVEEARKRATSGNAFEDLLADIDVTIEAVEQVFEKVGATCERVSLLSDPVEFAKGKGLRIANAYNEFLVECITNALLAGKTVAGTKAQSRIEALTSASVVGRKFLVPMSIFTSDATSSA